LLFILTVPSLAALTTILIAFGGTWNFGYVLVGEQRDSILNWLKIKWVFKKSPLSHNASSRYLTRQTYLLKLSFIIILPPPRSAFVSYLN